MFIIVFMFLCQEGGRLKKLVKGAIFYARLDPIVGSEQGGDRPVLIL